MANEIYLTRVGMTMTEGVVADSAKQDAAGAHPCNLIDENGRSTARVGTGEPRALGERATRLQRDELNERLPRRDNCSGHVTGLCAACRCVSLGRRAQMAD